MDMATSWSTLPDSLKYYKQDEFLQFGIQTSSNLTTINTNLYLTLILNTTKYQCQLQPIEAPHWPHIWHWCSTQYVDTLYCENTENIENYSIIITNEQDTPIFVDVISIATDQDVINVDTFNNQNIKTEEYSIAPYETINDVISIQNVSIAISLKSIINETAYNMTIIKDKINKCPSDIEAWFVFAPNEVSWNEAETHCQNVYGTHLAIIDTDAKMQLILQAFHQHGFAIAWIGLKQIDGQWIWVNGASCGYADEGDCVNDPHWGRNEPNGLPDELCAHVGENEGGYFNDNDCDMPYAFFCNLNQSRSTSLLEIHTTIISNNQTNNKSITNKGSVIATGDILLNSEEWIVIGMLIGLIVCCIGLLSYVYYRRNKKKDTNVTESVGAVQNDQESVDVTDNSVHVSSIESDVKERFTVMDRNGTTIEIDEEVMDKLSPLVNSHGMVYLKANNTESQENISTKSNTDSSSTRTSMGYSGTNYTEFSHKSKSIEQLY